jgi:hypothetical protein
MIKMLTQDSFHTFITDQLEEQLDDKMADIPFVEIETLYRNYVKHSEDRKLAPSAQLSHKQFKDCVQNDLVENLGSENCTLEHRFRSDMYRKNIQVLKGYRLKNKLDGCDSWKIIEVTKKDAIVEEELGLSEYFKANVIQHGEDEKHFKELEEFYVAYQQYCKDKSKKPMNKLTFNKGLKEKLKEPLRRTLWDVAAGKKRERVRVYVGIEFNNCPQRTDLVQMAEEK